MLFNSFEFVGFFVAVMLAYFVLPLRSRVWMLLLASCYFYMAFVPLYILVLGGTIIIDYFAGLCIENSQGRRRSALLAVSILANVSVLAVFKYCNFILDNVSWLWSAAGALGPLDWRVGIVLPIGLSFHTFQAMSYTIEVYRGAVPSEKNFIHYALYVMYFPQLVAGPIERPQNILPQLNQPHRYDHGRVVDGLKLMAWGFFKKCVIADRLSILVDHVYDSPQKYVGGFLILATVFFAIQIYCDFSGYSDIAIGCARIMGIELMKNFHHPYLASTLSDFWRRWHISLSTWFRDYLYIPLGGSRCGPWIGYRNLMVTFLVSGLWHGASWNYVIWGGLNGAFLVLESLVLGGRKKSSPVWNLGWRILTLLVVLLTWVFFRARNFTDAIYIITHLTVSPMQTLKAAYVEGIGVNQFDWVVIGLTCLFLLVMEVWEERKSKPAASLLQAAPPLVRRSFYFLLVASIVFLGVMDSPHQFIYFQF